MKLSYDIFSVPRNKNQGIETTDQNKPWITKITPDYW